MFINYLKITFRTILKNKVFALVNIGGLAVSLAVCLTIAVFVLYEKSFDSMHSGNIYRLIVGYDTNGANQKEALSTPAMGPSLLEEFPEIENFARVVHAVDTDLSYEDNRIYLKRSMYADDAFLNMFDFALVEGNRKDVLLKPNSVVLTREAAVNLFGEEDALGKVLEHFASGDKILFKVTGIIESPPPNSHLQFEALFSMSTLIKPEYVQDWKGSWLFTYLQIRNGTDILRLEGNFPGFLEKYMSPKKDNWKSYSLFLQPLKDVHGLSSNILYDYINYHKFDRIYLYSLLAIGTIILLIAAINFVNLTTARSSERIREAGIRKSVGASKSQLWIQFVGEAVMMVSLALVVAIPLVYFSLPFVSQLSGRPLEFPLFQKLNWVLALLAAVFFIGFLAGVYPALRFSSTKTVSVLKGGSVHGRAVFRGALVVTQFSAAVSLIIATVFAVSQLRYLENRDPGFDKEQVMVVTLNARSNSKLSTLKEELERNQLILGTAASDERLGGALFQAEFTYRKANAPAREVLSSILVVDDGYLQLFGLDLIAGRGLDQESELRNVDAYIINETMAAELLRDDPDQSIESLIGTPFGINSTGEIIGIVRDFNFNTLHHKIEPLSIFNQAGFNFSELNIKIRDDHAVETIRYVASVWERIFPGEPFEYTFLDTHFAGLYTTEGKLSGLVGLLGGVAILSSCMGLFALSLYTTQRREKEIGIRKVLGADLRSLVITLSSDFVRLVFIANLLAWPVAWYCVHNWLDGFAYRISIDWHVFPMTGLIVMLVAFTTVCFNVIKAAVANPVESLRNE